MSARPARLANFACLIRSAHLLISSRQARRLLATVGFSLPARTEFLFVFPRWLRSLRRLEVPLRHLPLGAQYLVVGVKLEASMSRHALAESR